MAANPKPRLSWQEYLEIERAADVKSEFIDGEMFLMAGGTSPHSLISANIIRLLGNQLAERDCYVYTADMRVRISAIEKSTYPDVTIVCGQREFTDEREDTLLNPTVIIEVFSDSMEGYDRGKKFHDYQLLDSFKEYVLIAQQPYQVEHFIRQTDNSWLYRAYTDAAAAVLFPAIDCQLRLADIYLKVA